MDQGASDDQIAAADTAIRSTEHVVGVTYMSPQACWQFTATCCPPTPTCRMLSLTITRSTPTTALWWTALITSRPISQQLRQIDGVYQVNAPLEMSKVFVSLQKIVSYACYGIVLVLAIVSIVVINNTIKITIFTRRKEIGIMRLVGATNTFIRLPFIVEGITSGLISAALASGIICGAYYALTRWYAENLSNLSQMFGGQLVPLADVWYYLVGGFALLGFVLCGIGTATSIRKHLNV